jgi:predicted nucleotidyltransferase
MSQYGWADCPDNVRTQVNTFLETLREILEDNLVSIYLHGSLAMGCFNPERSDIDLLIVTGHGMTVETKRTIAELLLRSSMAPSPIEISFLVEQQIRLFQHPLPFDMHYSESWREKYQQVLANGEWARWNDETKKDIDLSAHLMVARKRGICLYGKPEVLGVPAHYYSASIVSDYVDARDAGDAKAKMPVYFVLNACRVYAYLSEGTIFSKDEGGVWALHSLPEDLRGVVAQALEIYRGNRKDEIFDEIALTGFALYMDEHIKVLYDIRGQG